MEAVFFCVSGGHNASGKNSKMKTTGQHRKNGLRLASGLEFWVSVLGGPGGLSKWVISRVTSTLNGVTLIITLLINDLLSPLGLQVGFSGRRTMRFGLGVLGLSGT